MRQFFDDELTIDNISPTDAADWRSWLAQRDLSEATVRLHCRNAKRLFNVSVEQELIDRNPFKRLKSTSIAAEKSEYTGLEVFEKLLAPLNHQTLKQFGENGLRSRHTKPFSTATTSVLSVDHLPRRYKVTAFPSVATSASSIRVR